MKSLVKIGTRGSQLAVYQAELTKNLIQKSFSMVQVEIVKIKTSGDMIRQKLADPFETKRVFTREIEEALLKKEVDAAVHSAKDLSVQLPEGLKIGAVLAREDARDCLISKDHKRLAEMPMGSRIGTSSVRRKTQLLRHSPELIIEDLRGNVDTRIKKLESGRYDGIVLAMAGVKRLGLTQHVAEAFDEKLFYPSPGQGAIVVQTRSEDAEMDGLLSSLDDEATATRLECERAFLRRLEGGCQLPCGISTRLEDGRLFADGALFAIDERDWVEGGLEGAAQDAAKLGIDLAEALLAKGGRKIIEKIKRVTSEK